MPDKSNLTALYKLVQNKQGKNFVRKYWVSNDDLKNIRQSQKFDTKDSHTNSLGVYNPIRKVLHERISDKVIDSSPMPNKGEKPKVILLMGGAASGKSTIIRNYIEPKYGKDSFGVLNVDDIKEALPEYEKFISEDIETAADRVHEESSDIGKLTLAKLVNSGRNFIYDAVLGNSQKATKLINDLYDCGYDIELVGVTVDTKSAWERTSKRAFGENGEGGTGRFVPEQPFFSGHRGTVNTFLEFDRSKVKSYALFDNNVPFGEQPILIEDETGLRREDLKEKFMEKQNLHPEDVLTKSYIPLDDYFESYYTIKKAFNEDKVGSDTFLNASTAIKNIIKSIQPLASVKFSDTTLDVKDLMEAVAYNSEFQHYADALVLNNKSQLLITQRTNSDDFQGGMWCLPGGKVENGEYLRDGVKRELFEETGLKANGCNYSTLYRNPDGSFSHYFFCNVEDFDDIRIDADEIQQYVWIDLNDLGNYEFMFDLCDRIKSIFNIPFKAKVLSEQEYAAIAENRIEKGNTITSLETSYKKGCLMLDVPFGERGDDNKWDREVLGKIDLDDVYNVPGFGLDFEPHVTVLYGFDLGKVLPYHIEKLLPENPISFSISDVSYFESSDYDVLKFGIYSPQLIELNKIYRNLPHENSYPDYKPHLTIAYLKKGKAEKYIEVLKDFVNCSFQSSKLDYSYNNEEGLKAKMNWDVKGYQTIEDNPEDIQKSFDNNDISAQEYFDLLKAKQYQIGQISQKTGLKKVGQNKWVDPKTGKEVKTDENGVIQEVKKEPIDVSKMGDKELLKYAKNSSETDLQKVIKESNNPKLRAAAHTELDRRSKQEAPQKEEEKISKMEAFEVIRKAFDLGKIDSITFQKAYEVIEKAKGNLVAKKVFAKRKDGKVYMTTVWVNPDSGEQIKKPDAGYVEAPFGTPETIVGDSVKITKKDGTVLEGILSYIHAWTDKKTGLQNADFHVQDSEGKVKKVVIGKIGKFEKFVNSVELEPEGEKDKNGYTILKTLGGSTGALLVQKNGIKYVKKTAADSNHLANEVRSLKYFAQMGVEVPKVEQYIKGEAVYLEFIEGKELGKINSGTEEYKKACAEISKNFIAHALMMNWDVIGMNLDNVMIKPDGTPVFIDVGGSMGYRAQGGIKTQWNDWDTGAPISELSAMLDSNMNATCSKVMKTGFSHYYETPFEKLEENNLLAKILKSQINHIKSKNPEWYNNPSEYSAKLMKRLDATENALDVFLNPSTDFGFTPPKISDEEFFKDIEKQSKPKEKSFEEKFEDRLKEVEKYGTALNTSYRRIRKLFSNEINTCEQYKREDVKEFYEDLAKHMAITAEEADSFKIYKHSGFEKNDKEFLSTVKGLGIGTNHLESIRTHTGSSGSMNPIFRELVSGLEDGYNISFKNEKKVSFNKEKFLSRLQNPSENFNSCRLMIDLFSKIRSSDSKFYRKNITLYRGIKLDNSTVETMGRNGNNIFSEAGVASNAQTYEKSWTGCKVVQSNVEGIDVHTVGTHPNELETITKPYNMLQVTSFHDTALDASDTNINENGRMQIRVEKPGLIPLKF